MLNYLANTPLGYVGVGVSHTRMARRSAEYLLQTLEIDA